MALMYYAVTQLFSLQKTLRMYIIIIQLLLLLCAGVTSQTTIHITQTRVAIDSEPKWPVMGVASVELGTDILGYRFDCTSSNEGYSMTQLTWERVGHTINPFEVSRTSNGGSRLEVESRQLITDNLGLYRCKHRATGESASLLIRDASPAIIADKEVVAAKLNQSLTLLVHISTYIGPLPENHTTWHLPSGQDLNENDRSVQHYLTGSGLTITNLSTDHLGEYTCTVMQLQEDTVFTKSTSVHVQLFIPASIVSHPSPVTVLEGENATLTCSGTGSSELSINWNRAGVPSTEISRSTHKYIIETTGEKEHEAAMTTTLSSTLILLHVSSDDAGVYFCEVHNELAELSSTVESTPVSITVTTLIPSVKITYDNVTSQSHTVVLFSGDSTMPAFSCSADGHPSPSVSWNISLSGPSSANVRYTYVLTQTELILVWEQPLEAADSGIYECIAKNSRGESRATVNLTVIYKPVIDSVVPAPGVKLSLLGKDDPVIRVEVHTNSVGRILTCSGYAWPTPQIQWTALSGDFPCETSSIVRTHHGFVTAELVFDTSFNGSCVGTFECTVALSQFKVENSSFRVLLIEGGIYSQTIIPFQLSLKSVPTVCTLWTERQKMQIRTQFEHALSRALTTECDMIAKNITVSILLCGEENAVILGGTLSNQPSTEKTYYSLLQWKNSGPLISFNGSLCEVDTDFPLCPPDSQACEHINSDCTSEMKNLSEITLVVYITSGVLFVVVLVIIFILLYKKKKPQLCHRTTSRIPSYELEDDAEKRNSYVSTTTSRSDEPVLH